MPEQRIALVTGGNRGIGLELCRQLGQQQARVILGSRDLAKGVAAAAELKASGLPVEARQLDVANVQSIRECMNWIRREVGRLDILINNAGIMVEDDDADPLEELEIVRDTMQTNVYGPLLLSRLAIPIMKTRRYGRIVNLSSGMGALSEMGAGYVAYRMSKAGINVVTRVLAAETEGMGILVNSVDPGWVRTAMGGRGASRTVEKGAETPLWLATLPDDGPTGGFFRDRRVIAW
ncbi:MAG TPA: SDR family oxidoreductase [Gemmatimonadaceae bacterium]|jgi:NAD(P)-dependent dehydrogenase (short-subunit alcohol dehydrogenase family)|nr:SDR family oxidoreductase [Gemmatimonadaceae bacterium]